MHQENFERAAELRDQIRSLEAAHQEQKETKYTGLSHGKEGKTL